MSMTLYIVSVNVKNWPTQMILNWNDFTNKTRSITEYKLHVLSNILTTFESTTCRYTIIIVFCELFNILLFYFFCKFFILAKYRRKYPLHGEVILRTRYTFTNIRKSIYFVRHCIWSLNATYEHKTILELQ